MAVYVDDMEASYRGMKMCHMLGDSEDELHAMADTIGVNRRWYQGDHYDICLAKRALAVKAGAIEITFRQCGAMAARRKQTGVLGSPKDAIKWVKEFHRARRAAKEASNG